MTLFNDSIAFVDTEDPRYRQTGLIQDSLYFSRNPTKRIIIFLFMFNSAYCSDKLTS